MRRAPIFLDSFSGAAADLPRPKRSYDNVLRALAKSPRVSCWDMEQGWLRNCLKRLELDALIVEDKDEPYPWLRFNVTAAGRTHLESTAGDSGSLGQQGMKGELA